MMILITFLNFLICGSVVFTSAPRRIVKTDPIINNPTAESYVSTQSQLGKRDFEEKREEVVPRDYDGRPRMDPTTDTETTNTQSSASSNGPVFVKSEYSGFLCDDILDIYTTDLSSFQIDEDFFSIVETKTINDSDIYSGPFRADYQGKTVIINADNSIVSLKEFQNHLLAVCELNPFFQQLSLYPHAHYFKESELERFQVNQDFDGNTPLQLPRMHPLFELAREFLVCAVANGKLYYIQDALDAGMSLNFNFVSKVNGLRMNLLHLAIRSSFGVKPVELVKFLVNEAKIDPNAVDSSGHAPFHYLADMDDRLHLINALLEVGSNPNFMSVRPEFNAPIHIAMNTKNSRFLKSFIYLPEVDINLLDFSGQHIVHLAILKRSFSCFSDLLNHPRIILNFDPLRAAFALIIKEIPEDDTRYLDALASHVIKRRRVHLSHLRYIIFQLIHSEFIPALNAFNRQGFDFNFVHQSNNGRPNSTPLIVAIRHDRLNSFKFLQELGISLTDIDQFPHAILFAISQNSIKIIQHLLNSTSFSKELISKCLNQIIQLDRGHLFRLFLSKFGNEPILRQISGLNLDYGPLIKQIVFSLI